MRTSLILAVLLSLVHPGSARAQSQITTGVIDGVATDATGAALPGVTIEARNVDTNFTRTSVTAADGRFALLQLPPGHYKVTFTLAGFATLVPGEPRAYRRSDGHARGFNEGVGRVGNGHRDPAVRSR